MAELADLPAIATAFGHRLHGAGVPITPERSARFATAVTLAEPTDLTSLYWLGRTTLLSGHDQIAIYDRVFANVFRAEFALGELARRRDEEPMVPSAMPGDDAATGDATTSGTSNRPHGSAANPSEQASDDGDDTPSVLAAMSVEERLNERDFSTCSEDELALIRRLVDELRFIPPMRRARRTRAHHSGQKWDVRGTMRRAHRTGGDPVDLVMRRRTERPRRVLLLADVSGSMEPYARVYLHLMRGAVQALNAEAFVFATRLTRLTKALADTDPDTAYRKAAAAATDWSSGTRIGAALHTFVEEHGRRGLARGAIIVIVSDGWEIEDPALIGRSMERLSRLAHQIIWVNPRKAAPGYEPLVRGMAEALPFVDTFVSGHSVRALQDVMEAIAAARDRSASPAIRSRLAS